MTEWMDQLTQAATRLAAERHRDIAFLRSTAAAGATDPVVRARLEREAAEATALADGYAARAAELAVGNEPWEEVEIEQQVEQARVAATYDVLDGPGETTEQLRQREIADATMLSYLTWQQEGVPPQEIAQRLERVSPIGAKAVSDYEQLLAIGYEPDEARAIAADTAAQDPIPADGAAEDEAEVELFEPDVPDPVAAEVEQLAFDHNDRVGRDAAALFEKARRDGRSEDDASDEVLGTFPVEDVPVADTALGHYLEYRRDGLEPTTAAELAALVAADELTPFEFGREPTVDDTDTDTDTDAAGVDDPDVVVIDPDELMPAGEAMRNYFVAEDAVGRFAQLRSEGWDDDTAAARAVEASLDETGLAAAAITGYRRQLDTGQDHETARFTAVSDAATAFTSRISAEQAEQVRAALTQPADATEHAAVHDTEEESTVDDNELTNSAQDAGSREDYDDIFSEEAYAERDTTGAAGTADEDVESTDADTGFWAEVAQRREALIADGVEMNEAADRAWLDVCGERGIDPASTVSTAQPDESRLDPAVGERDVDDAGIAYMDPTSPLPERAPEAGSWIARNLTYHEQDEADARAEDREEMERARDVVRSLPDGSITDDDLARVGVTAEQYDRLMIEEWSPEADRAPEPGSWIDRNFPAQAAESPDVPMYERDAGDRLQDWIEEREDELEADERDATEQVLDDIDDVLAEERGYALIEKERARRENAASDADTAENAEPPLADRIAECERAVEAVANFVPHHETSDEDSERAERCARWNAEDAAAEQAVEKTEGWGQ
ncbi:hypothetical protein NQK81_12910 [Amycolatopsis roodepoortensis]|uniref:hypothetical protein n=1 Tax=Amycolatopsis roodepoortensis TaxID=700274 RepID=UPI00214C1633|nr:hypothetical protein [Amycolatopsis roodepoortensis]UUV34305.1 hypothetical protein NQK81_12910 [Amycolatopsis roodepoortensis]